VSVEIAHKERRDKWVKVGHEEMEKIMVRVIVCIMVNC